MSWLDCTHRQHHSPFSHFFLAATALVEGKIGKSLKKVLKKVVAKEAHEQLAISDAKLGGVIKVCGSALSSLNS